MGDTIKVHSDVNIGVAVAVPDGLLVPVINNADQKSMTYINQEVRTLQERPKTKSFNPKKCLVILLPFRILECSVLRNLQLLSISPDSCILAVGSIVEKPVVKNGAIVVGNIMKVTLSCDHRVVDGASGAQFLQTLRGMLENPIRMIV